MKNFNLFVLLFLPHIFSMETVWDFLEIGGVSKPEQQK